MFIKKAYLEASLDLDYYPATSNDKDKDWDGNGDDGDDDNSFHDKNNNGFRVEHGLSYNVILPPTSQNKNDKQLLEKQHQGCISLNDLLWHWKRDEYDHGTSHYESSHSVNNNNHHRTSSKATKLKLCALTDTSRLIIISFSQRIFQ